MIVKKLNMPKKRRRGAGLGVKQKGYWKSFPSMRQNSTNNQNSTNDNNANGTTNRNSNNFFVIEYDLDVLNTHPRDMKCIVMLLM